MSNPDIDYSNTIIYKITCKDPNIHDVYVGHTVNFVQRKKAHRVACMNNSSPSHNCKVYKVIRNNGGWDNWSMDIIAFYKCKDLNEARQKEQEYFVALNATMNSIEPFPSKHVNRIIHVNPLTVNNPTYNENIPISNNPRILNCEPCNFVTTCKSDYERHVLTQKHLDGGRNDLTPIKLSNDYSCPRCQKKFKFLSSLYRHTDCNTPEPFICSTASITEPVATIPDVTVPAMPTPPPPQLPVITGQSLQEVTMNFATAMMSFFQKNNEFNYKMMEFCLHHSRMRNTTTPTNHPFNMNRFLNEKCKDAMNMTDFVNSIPLNLTDLENVGRLGYVKGMSNILIDNLQKMDVYKRPVHCSDAKRDTLYVKDDDEWELDGHRHPKMANAIRALEEKNDALIEEWANQHPNCMNDDTRENKQYLKIRNAITLGSITKVICRVAKTITIEKE